MHRLGRRFLDHRSPCAQRWRAGASVLWRHREVGRRECTWRHHGLGGQDARGWWDLASLGWRRRHRGSRGRSKRSRGIFLKPRVSLEFQHQGRRKVRLIGSIKSRAALRPELAPWSDSGAKRIVAPLEPPVPVSLS